MPNLPAHINLAFRAAQRLGHSTLDRNMGCFLLGSTTPDIRVITRKRREDYHFAPLDFDTIGAGVEGLFCSHPHLQSSSAHGEATQAFIAGYITHLISDETWIVNMYRPLFGNSEVFENETHGKVMDRVLQLELDRQALLSVDPLLMTLEGATNWIEVGFIGQETIAQWQEWVRTFLKRGFAWERLRSMAGRIAAGDENHPAHLVADEFLQAMPGSLEQLYALVPQATLEAYKDRAVDSLVRAVEDYLP